MLRWTRSARAATWLLAALAVDGVTLALAHAQPEPAASASATAKAPLPALPGASAAASVAPPPKPAPPKPAVTAPTPAPAATAKKPAPPTTKLAKTTPKPHGIPGVRAPDAWARRQVAGGPSEADVALGAETPELRALRQAELELFPPAIPPLGTPWPSELASPMSAASTAPHVHATGLPPSPVPSAPPVAEGSRDLSWLSRLEMPDLPVRWDARLVRYLEFYKDDPRGRQLITYWLKRSGRYREGIRRQLRRKALPEDLSWLPMIESGYDATARSPAGAGGLWQLTSDTAHLYGLSTDRWADQRFNATAETDAALEMLADLYRRFGSWELAMAGYNMGYGGVMSVVRRYNTNDYWTLSRLEAALPWETTLYVPKLIAAAIVGRNLATFGLADVALDAPIEGDEVRVPPGTALSAVASAAGCTLDDVKALNPELRAGRTPPAPTAAPGAAPLSLEEASYPVKVPVGKGRVAETALLKNKDGMTPLERYVVRFGESLDQIAVSHKLPTARISELNGIASGEVLKGGTVLLLPRGSAVPVAAAAGATIAPAVSEVNKPVAVVPQDMFVYPDRRRVFYRVLTGDTLPDIATHLHVTTDDLRRWNDLDPAARLQDGMTLQVFVPEAADVSRSVVLGEKDVRVLVAGTDEFFAYWEGTRGKRRLVVTAKATDTLETISRKYGVNAASMERINRKGRKDALKDGESVVVYLPTPGGEKITVPPAGVNTALLELASAIAPTPNGPLPVAPLPDALPALPENAPVR
jgi:membrane-bound lytic murein transglycosylase D